MPAAAFAVRRALSTFAHGRRVRGATSPGRANGMPVALCAAWTPRLAPSLVLLAAAFSGCATAPSPGSHASPRPAFGAVPTVLAPPAAPDEVRSMADVETARGAMPLEVVVAGVGGSNDRFNAGGAEAAVSIGYYLNDVVKISVRQNGSYSDQGKNAPEIWNSTCRAALDLHLPLGIFVPYVGVNFGYVYGDTVRDSMMAGPRGRREDLPASGRLPVARPRVPVLLRWRQPADRLRRRADPLHARHGHAVLAPVSRPLDGRQARGAALDRAGSCSLPRSLCATETNCHGEGVFAPFAVRRHTLRTRPVDVRMTTISSPANTTQQHRGRPIWLFVVPRDRDARRLPPRA